MKSISPLLDDIDEMSEEELKDELRRIEIHEIKRLENNQYRYYEPNGKCEEFIEEVGLGKAFVVLFSAANGVGKSAAGANVVAHFAFKSENPYFDYPLFQKFPYPKKGRIVTDPKNIIGVIDTLREWMPKGQYSSKKAGKTYDSEWETKTGWKWDIMSYDQDPKEFEGATLGWAWFDEPPPESIFKATVARMRKGGIIFITATPLTGSAWMYDHIVAPQTKESIVKGQRAYIQADVESACFDSDTEILTEVGWKSFDDVKIGERVVSMDKSSRTLMYRPIKEIIRKSWSGKLVEIGKGILATPDHRMLVLDSDEGDGRTVVNMPLRTVEAKDLRRGLRMLPFSDNGFSPTRFESPFPDKVSAEDWCEFMGWYLAEGWSNGTKGGKVLNYGVGICQKNKEKKEHIKKLLARTKWNWHLSSSETGLFRANDKELYLHLFPLGNSHNKYIPRYLFEYPKKCLEKLWFGLVMGDGDGDKRYLTISTRLADDVQELLFRMGYKSSNKQWKDCSKHIIRGRKIGISGKKMNCVRKGARQYYYIIKKPGRRSYNGLVSCVTVDSDIIVVRNKNAKYPLITHNCKTHGIRGHLEHKHIEKMISEYSEDEKQARVKGQFQHLVGLVFKKFDRKIHVIPAFKIGKKDYTVYEALDPHPRTPDMVNWLAVDKNGTKFVVDELFIKAKTSTLVARIEKIADRYRVERRIADPSAFVEDKHDPDPEKATLSAQLREYGLDYEPATKARTKANRRIGDALDYEMSGREMIVAPELYIFDTCVRTIYEFEHFQWDEWRGRTADNKSPKEKTVDKDDHSLENCGRLLLLEPQHTPYHPSKDSEVVAGKGSDSFDPY